MSPDCESVCVFFEGDFLQDSSGFCFSLPKLMLENSTALVGEKSKGIITVVMSI